MIDLIYLYQMLFKVDVKLRLEEYEVKKTGTEITTDKVHIKLYLKSISNSERFFEIYFFSIIYLSINILQSDEDLLLVACQEEKWNLVKVLLRDGINPYITDKVIYDFHIYIYNHYILHRSSYIRL